MKRSNRLILLIGVFLAIVAFVGIVLFVGQPPGSPPGGPTGVPTQLPTVFANREIKLGTPITLEMLDQKDQPVTGRDATAFSDRSLVVGKIVRKNVASGKQLTAEDFASNQTQIDTPAGQRAMAVQVDQVSGAGTLIKPGDYVDLVIAFTGDKFPIITINPDDDTFTVVAGVNPTSSKVLLQGMQALGTLLPPAPTNPDGTPAADPSTTLSGQSEIVLLSVSAQQAEIIKFGQLDGSITLVLRSPADFIDPVTGDPIVPPASATSGITLRTLVDEYGILIPQLVEAVLPNQNP